MFNHLFKQFRQHLVFFSFSLEPNTLIKRIHGTRHLFTLVTSPSNAFPLSVRFHTKRVQTLLKIETVLHDLYSYEILVLVLFRSSLFSGFSQFQGGTNTHLVTNDTKEGSWPCIFIQRGRLRFRWPYNYMVVFQVSPFIVYR